jgi:hypothetical protein
LFSLVRNTFMFVSRKSSRPSLTVCTWGMFNEDFLPLFGFFFAPASLYNL